jgi:hypothetical protein
LVDLCKTCGQNVTSQTGYETWICEVGKNTFLNLDFEVNERQFPPKQKSKLNHELTSSSTWKLGLIFLSGQACSKDPVGHFPDFCKMVNTPVQ